MAVIDLDAREIRVKIVYVGPTLGGKTTNLKALYGQLPPHLRSDLVSIDTERERTLFFDFLPLEVAGVGGFSVRFQLYTVPGHNGYARTRQTVLNGVDGIVFVADSTPDATDRNRESLDELAETFKRRGRTIDDMPLVFQYNKRDLPTAVPADELDRLLNPGERPRFTAVATDGTGVVETLTSICRLVVRAL